MPAIVLSAVSSSAQRRRNSSTKSVLKANRTHSIPVGTTLTGNSQVPPTKKLKIEAKPGQAYVVNQLVEHKKFGLGRVKEYLDLGEDSIVVVKFNSGNTKSLMVKYAKINAVGGQKES